MLEFADGDDCATVAQTKVKCLVVLFISIGEKVSRVNFKISHGNT